MEVEGPYILPVQFDDTRVPGLPKTTAELDARTHTAVEIADLAIEHLREHGIEVPPPPAQRDMAQRVAVRGIPGKTLEGKWEVPYEVHNGSDYPIDGATLVINDPGRDGKPEDQMGTAYELVIGTVHAGETKCRPSSPGMQRRLPLHFADQAKRAGFLCKLSRINDEKLAFELAGLADRLYLPEPDGSNDL